MLHAAHAPRNACTAYHVTMGGQVGVEEWRSFRGDKQMLLEWESGGLWFVGTWRMGGPEVTPPEWSGCRRGEASSISSHRASLISFSRFLRGFMQARAFLSPLFILRLSKQWGLRRGLGRLCLHGLSELLSWTVWSVPQATKRLHSTQISVIESKERGWGAGGHAAGRLCAERIFAGGHRLEMWQAAVCYLWYCDRCLSTVWGELGEKQITIKIKQKKTNQKRNWSRVWEIIFAGFYSKQSRLVVAIVCNPKQPNGQIGTYQVGGRGIDWDSVVRLAIGLGLKTPFKTFGLVLISEAFLRGLYFVSD